MKNIRGILVALWVLALTIAPLGTASAADAASDGPLPCDVEFTFDPESGQISAIKIVCTPPV